MYIHVHVVSYTLFREDILKATSAITEAADLLAQRAGGNLLEMSDGTLALPPRPSKELALAARTAVSAVSSQASLLKTGAASLPRDGQVGRGCVHVIQ